MRPTRLLVLAALVGASAVACGGDDGSSASPGAATPPASIGTPTVIAPDAPTPAPVGADATFTLELRGDVAVPPGDPDARGSADLLFDLAAGEVCYRVEVEGADPIDGMHIHQGAVGETGPVVVELEPPSSGSIDTCTAADPAALHAVVEAPEEHYLNLHDATHPEGTLRAQLG